MFCSAIKHRNAACIQIGLHHTYESKQLTRREIAPYISLRFALHLHVRFLCTNECRVISIATGVVSMGLVQILAGIPSRYSSPSLRGDSWHLSKIATSQIVGDFLQHNILSSHRCDLWLCVPFPSETTTQTPPRYSDRLVSIFASSVLIL